MCVTINTFCILYIYNWQAEFNETVTVSAISTQGRSGHNQYVTSYKMVYSDGVSYMFIEATDETNNSVSELYIAMTVQFNKLERDSKLVSTI